MVGHVSGVSNGSLEYATFYNESFIQVHRAHPFGSDWRRRSRIEGAELHVQPAGELQLRVRLPALQLPPRRPHHRRTAPSPSSTSALIRLSWGAGQANGYDNQGFTFQRVRVALCFPSGERSSWTPNEPKTRKGGGPSHFSLATDPGGTRLAPLGPLNLQIQP